MFNLFRRATGAPKKTFCLHARYGVGSWIKRFDLEAYTAYEACRIFDQEEQYREWVRVSGACLTDPIPGATHK